VGGVGYELEAPMSTFYGLPGVGDEVRLLTHLVVREDAHILYGFATDAERQLFRNLLKVSGVGPKLALGILSGTSVDGFSACVESGDSAALTRIPGIGRKTAERLLTPPNRPKRSSVAPCSRRRAVPRERPRERRRSSGERRGRA
ncbi:MAG: Holliday junction branch migration protein RuvA, partial [Gammaproteobacteria bacterium]|nr:Holliday junction branch migration protein RuvA [Gammaproteobacteria bacterium]